MANFQRQFDILPPESLIYPINLIGLGGINSRVAYDVRKMGFTMFHLWDDDVVEGHNLTSQHFDDRDKGQSKVAAIDRQLHASLDTRCQVTRHEEKFTENDNLEGIVISGVDNMDSRQQIWNSIQKSLAFVSLMIDGRIGIEWDEEKQRVSGEWIEILTVIPADFEDRDLYEKHLFTDQEAAPLRCTAQAVAYVGSTIAGFIGGNLRNWITGDSYPKHFIYDCLTNQILVARF